MRYLFTIIILFLVLLSAAVSHSANRALLVGVGEYEMKGINLPGIDKDIEMMHEVALKLGYRKNDIRVLLNKQATLKNIRTAIDTWLTKGVGPDDHVLFYFSGHGSQIYDRNKDEPDKADEVLVTHDASIGVNTLNNVFVDDMFNAMLAKIPSKNVFILIDACHSGTATRGLAKSKGVFPKFLEYPGMPRTARGVSFASKSIEGVQDGGYSALSAAQDNQRAQASNIGSFFTRAVSESVTKARTQGRSITMLALHDETTTFIAKEMPDPSLVHKPALLGGLESNRKNLFITTKAQPPKVQKEAWSDDILELRNNGAYTVSIKTNGKSYKVGDPLVITCHVKESGYVNIITMQPGDKVPTVLFPNQFHQDNWVEGGKSVTIPSKGDSFALAAAPPTGRSLIAAFVTPFAVNFYKEGYGDGSFRMMSRESTRGFVVTPAPPKPETAQPPETKPKPRRYGAGIVYAKIK